MALFDEERPKKTLAHEIGCDLSMISVDELVARVALLKEEIARLEADIKAKSASKSAAESLFKK
ncbi:DUF1192 domain-containing protein [Rhizobium sp. L1K21]|uniref:DUF1192 domain-containing protein n=1 Tax=Rhizobium sp. L1K21 TaxID=2954933 RepID=UPI0020928256|nr:DUF1192 domain-containing protein [Rhizobium sp. L1K21]MCO6185090.1 DUF1192 domain-containing protein [Rhizobium sp. L1K21]